MQPKLNLWDDYSRADVHAIFAPGTPFSPGAGTWGLHGIIEIPERPGEFVFFVTAGSHQAGHDFDESITRDGLLTWQSQPSMKLADSIIRQLIAHDPLLNRIYLFIRSASDSMFTYVGTLRYVSHDPMREKPVHFQWQLLAWPPPPAVIRRVGPPIFPN